jgi:L-aspartate oxidase
VELRASNVLLATGGGGQLYSVTTNPIQSTADGLAMVMRAGVPVADVEFVQFHPTALHGPTSGPRPLMSEALRGEGAVLRDNTGRRFVDELQPRDVVAAAVAATMRESGIDHVWLDVTPVEDFDSRFPTLAESARAMGLDPPRDWLPVAPAAHYMCGGVLTDLDGATFLPGLWAAGEVSCSGVQGANRLASNSLLEGMVFGARVVEAILSDKDGPDATGALNPLLTRADIEPGSLPLKELANQLPTVRVDPGAAIDENKSRERLQRAMSAGAGVVRDAGSLASAAAVIEDLSSAGVPPGELANLLIVARALVGAAVARQESRGGHRRSDFPDRSGAFSHRFLQ